MWTTIFSFILSFHAGPESFADGSANLSWFHNFTTFTTFSDCSGGPKVPRYAGMYIPRAHGLGESGNPGTKIRGYTGIHILAHKNS